MQVKNTKWYRIFKKAIVILLSLLLFIFLLVLLLFSLKKDDIKKEVLNYVNTIQNGEGSIIIDLWEDIPSFDIKYKVLQFDVAQLFSTFMEDTVIVGKMDLDLDFML